MSRRSTTISHVATKCGVSLQTVSNVLNGRSGQASADTRARVIATAREMNYYPNAVARGLNRRRMNTLGVALAMFEGSVLTHEFAGPILDGVLEAMTQAGQDVILYTGHMTSDTEASVSLYCDGRCDGLLIMSAIHGNAIANRLHDVGKPFVVVGQKGDADWLPWVGIDHFAAAAAMTSHLIEYGHRRIAFLCGFDEMSVSRQRQEAFLETMASSGIGVDESLIVPGTFTVESGRERAFTLFSRPIAELPTAIFCASDAIAVGAIEALKSLGLCVPDDVSVTGFDDAPSALRSDPPLTTIRQPLKLIGRSSVELLLDIVLERSDTRPFVRLDAELIVRKSVAPPRGETRKAAHASSARQNRVGIEGK